MCNKNKSKYHTRQDFISKIAHEVHEYKRNHSDDFNEAYKAMQTGLKKDLLNFEHKKTHPISNELIIVIKKGTTNVKKNKLVEEISRNKIVEAVKEIKENDECKRICREN